MALAYLTGSKTINISDAKAQKILEWKEGGRDSKSLVDLGTGDFIELGQIKGVKIDELEPESIIDKERNEKMKELIREWYAHVERLRAMPADEKAHWMNRTFCQLLYNARLNKGRIDKDSDLYLYLFNATVGHFEANPDDYHAPKETYQHLIKAGDLNIPKSVGTMKSIGSLIQKTI